MNTIRHFSKKLSQSTGVSVLVFICVLIIFSLCSQVLPYISSFLCALLLKWCYHIISFLCGFFFNRIVIFSSLCVLDLFILG